jgi:hypothetical protein
MLDNKLSNHELINNFKDKHKLDDGFLIELIVGFADNIDLYLITESVPGTLPQDFKSFLEELDNLLVSMNTEPKSIQEIKTCDNTKDEVKLTVVEAHGTNELINVDDKNLQRRVSSLEDDLTRTIILNKEEQVKIKELLDKDNWKKDELGNVLTKFHCLFDVENNLIGEVSVKVGQPKAFVSIVLKDKNNSIVARAQPCYDTIYKDHKIIVKNGRKEIIYTIKVDKE